MTLLLKSSSWKNNVAWHQHEVNPLLTTLLFRAEYIFENVHYGNTGCGVFKRGVQNKKDFCLRFLGNFFSNSVPPA